MLLKELVGTGAALLREELLSGDSEGRDLMIVS